MTARAALLLLAAALGCTSTTYARPGSATAQDWLARRASSHVEAEVAADPPADRTVVVIDARSPTDIRFVASDASVVPIERVRKVVANRHGLGALEGAALGLGAGALIGLLYGGSRPLASYEQSMDCTIVCNRADATIIGALMFGTLGWIVGVATGAIIGSRDVLDLR